MCYLDNIHWRRIEVIKEKKGNFNDKLSIMQECCVAIVLPNPVCTLLYFLHCYLLVQDFRIFTSAHNDTGSLGILLAVCPDTL